jgi:dynactin complex subunit
MPGSPNRNIHKMEDAIVKLTDLESELNADIHALASLKVDITHMIKRVENRQERNVLEKRYLCYETWEQISVDMDYSIQHTFRIHDQGLKEIEKFLEDES